MSKFQRCWALLKCPFRVISEIKILLLLPVILSLRVLLGACLLLVTSSNPAAACAPCYRDSGKPVVNADQTVIILWDAAKKTEHFIRKASFKSDADDFGFLIPSPTEPELAESGNEAFPFLQALTEPKTITMPRPSGGGGCNFGCGAESAVATKNAAPSVRVLAEKEVAGFHAVVLETKSSDALVDWLKEHGYAFSPEVKAWATPYVEGGWKITALKVAKPKDGDPKLVAAGALRLSFQTDRPLFPYREPDPKDAVLLLGAKDRLLRIYFLADSRFDGELTAANPWTGKPAWANKLSPEDRKKTLNLLQLPETTGPQHYWLTEFEDNWPYRVAPADLYFAASAEQKTLERPPIIHYVASPLPNDAAFYALVAAAVVPLYLRRARRRRGDANR
jgi:hypothetical protein